MLFELYRRNQDHIYIDQLTQDLLYTGRRIIGQLQYPGRHKLHRQVQILGYNAELQRT